MKLNAVTITRAGPFATGETGASACLHKDEIESAPRMSAATSASRVRSTLVTNHQAKAWSNAEVRQLRELAEDGVPIVAIAKQLRRTMSAVRNKAGMHGISLRSGALSGSA